MLNARRRLICFVLRWRGAGALAQPNWTSDLIYSSNRKISNTRRCSSEILAHGLLYRPCGLGICILTGWIWPTFLVFELFFHHFDYSYFIENICCEPSKITVDLTQFRSISQFRSKFRNTHTNARPTQIGTLSHTDFVGADKSLRLGYLLQWPALHNPMYTFAIVAATEMLLFAQLNSKSTSASHCIVYLFNQFRAYAIYTTATVCLWQQSECFVFVLCIL